MTKKEMIIRTMCDFPHLNKWQIADRVGCHPVYVTQVENKWLKDKSEDVEPVEVQDVNTIDRILEERGSRYGIFKDHAHVTQGLKKAAYEFAVSKGKAFDSDQVEALDMIFHKIGRILNGDPNYIDSWDDIAGYAKLVADRLRGDAK
jgi:hypothetical protein